MKRLRGASRGLAYVARNGGKMKNFIICYNEMREANLSTEELQLMNPICNDVYEDPPLEDWLQELHFQTVVRRSFLQL
jgi:hypothetical protein